MVGSSSAARTFHFNVVTMMSEASIHLKMNTMTFATAAALYHRVFKTVTPASICPYTIGMTCLTLAGKIEEDHLRTRDVINVCFSIIHPEKPPLEDGDTFSALRNTINYCELFIMRTLQFHVRKGAKSFSYLTYYLNSVENWLPRDSAKIARLAEVSWGILRDSYHSAVCVDTSPQHLALASLSLALRLVGLEIPGAYLMQGGDVCWTKAFVDDLGREELYKLMTLLLDLYLIDDRLTEKEKTESGIEKSIDATSGSNPPKPAVSRASTSGSKENVHCTHPYNISNKNVEPQATTSASSSSYTAAETSQSQPEPGFLPKPAVPVPQDPRSYGPVDPRSYRPTNH